MACYFWLWAGLARGSWAVGHRHRAEQSDWNFCEPGKGWLYLASGREVSKIDRPSSGSQTLSRQEGNQSPHFQLRKWVERQLKPLAGVRGTHYIDGGDFPLNETDCLWLTRPGTRAMAHWAWLPMAPMGQKTSDLCYSFSPWCLIKSSPGPAVMGVSTTLLVTDFSHILLLVARRWVRWLSYILHTTSIPQGHCKNSHMG